MKRIVPDIQRHRHSSIRWRVRRFVNTLEYYSFRFFGMDNCPFGQSGAIVLACLILCAFTGVLLLFFYVPVPDQAVNAFSKPEASRLGRFIQETHRACADILVLAILLHMIRIWATERFRGPRSRNWRKGLVLLVVVGILGWSGYILEWNERAMVLIAWGQELALSPNKWPLIGLLRIGSLLSFPIFSAQNESDLLLRIFALHVGGALILIILLMWHLKRITPPRIFLPIRAWIVISILVIMVGQMMPFYDESLMAFNPFAPPKSIHVDIITTFPFLFYSILGAPLLGAILLIAFLGLFFLPDLRPYKAPAACINELLCDGCRLCIQDCSYNAIIMVPANRVVGTGKNGEIARIIPNYCSACGVCVGSCEAGAIDLPDLPQAQILERIESICARGSDVGNRKDIVPEVVNDI